MNHSIKKPLSLSSSKQTYIFITIVITSCLQLACSMGEAGETAASSSVPPDVIAEADRLFEDRKDLTKLRETISLLSTARNEYQKSFDLEWRLARANYFLGRHSTDEKEIEKAFEDGKKAGKIAAAMEPNLPNGHFWYGANLGEQADRSNLAVGIRSVGEIRDAMNKVIEIDPRYELASAYGVLGKIEIATRIMGGDIAKAIDHLERAVELEKNNGDVRLYLAEAYLAQDKSLEARKQLEHVLKMQPNPRYLPELEQQRVRARTMLEKNF